SFSYSPSAGFTGTDRFTYQASDGQLLSNVATVTLNVFAWPVANNASFETDENSVLTGQVTGMDPDGEPVTYHATAYPSHGSLALRPDGSFTYTPDSYYYGPDSFSFQVTDGQVFSNVATASISVNRVNLPPMANDDAYTVASGSVLTAAAGQTFVT